MEKKMRIAVAFLLFGFLGVLASPSCTQEEMDKCSENEKRLDNDDADLMETEESLDMLCSTDAKVAECHLNVMERCPDAGFRSKEAVEDAVRMYDILCDKSNSLRKKFLDNSRCLNNFYRNVTNICNNGEKVDLMADRDACNKLIKLLECAEKSVAEICGEEAKDAFIGLFDPGHQLRSANCVV